MLSLPKWGFPAKGLSTDIRLSETHPWILPHLQTTDRTVKMTAAEVLMMIIMKSSNSRIRCRSNAGLKKLVDGIDNLRN